MYMCVCVYVIVCVCMCAERDGEKYNDGLPESADLPLSRMFCRTCPVVMSPEPPSPHWPLHTHTHTHTHTQPHSQSFPVRGSRLRVIIAAVNILKWGRSWLNGLKRHVRLM